MDPSGYEILHELLRSERYVVERGRRRHDGCPVLLKAESRALGTAAAQHALTREYDVLRELSVAGVPLAYDLVPLDGRLVLVLEDGGGVPLDTLLAWDRPSVSRFFSIATRLCTILAEVHRHDIIHGSVGPLNVLVGPRDDDVWLLNFDAASRGPAETVPTLGPHASSATLAYLSPEQTGRMNRATDYRADLYSLGVTFYELLTGVHPFRSDDPLEVVHRHIAGTPLPPSEVNPALPAPLSRIVMKLLAKVPEERYQSALGLREDLARCASEWSAVGKVADFPLGGLDVGDRFLIPQKLYGREREVEELLGAFDRGAEGLAALLLVSGYAGIGKTSLIQELYKPIVRQRGYFSAGKFDQVARVPYGALIQAIRGLFRQLLSEPEARLARWRERLSTALGSGGSVLAEVVPEVELILGPQPPSPALGPTEAQNRFQLVFRNLLGALAGRDHPLVIFLDDLQWADSATLRLLGPLLAGSDIQSLLVIGAYRDNEVDAAHPLTKTIAGLQADGVQLSFVQLGPLALPDLTLLVRDTLHRESVDVEPLAGLVLQKTAGNPFFVIQFLEALEEARLLTFDYDLRRWTFGLDAIARADITDNVIDLLTGKIQRLSPDAQTLLTLAACIGSQFDLDTLAVVSERSGADTADALAEALEEGLVVHASGPSESTADDGGTSAEAPLPRYAFLHDRVQQAAYAMIPTSRKALVHLTVGRLLLSRWNTATTEQKLFDVVHHLNTGRALISDPAERLALARLDLMAGRRAKSSTAYQAALGYFQTGLELLPDDAWDTEYELALGLHLGVAECEYLGGQFDQAERTYDRLLHGARTRVDKAHVYALKVQQYEHRSQYGDAIRAGLEAVGLFGLSFPDRPEDRQRALDAETTTIQALIGERSIDALVELPTMSDPEIQALMRLLCTLHTSCFLSGDKPLTLLNAATMVRLSLLHGNTPESAYAYVLYGAMLLGPIKEDYRSAYEFGMLALHLSERLYDPAWRAKVLMMLAWAISLWRMPLEASFAYTREAFRLATDTGLFVDAAWALFNEIWFALLTSPSLDSFQRTYAPYPEYTDRIRMRHIGDSQRVLLQWGRALQGATDSPTSLTDTGFDDTAYRETYQGQRLFEMFYFVAKLALFYTFGDYRSAAAAARQAEAVIRRDFAGTIWDELRAFYHALTLAARHAEASLGERRDIEAQLEGLGVRLRRWAENSPRNFEPQALIVSAEIARIHGRGSEAMSLYEAAIDAATQAERLRERALANELYAAFWLERGRARAAAVFMADARETYAQWGAGAKVRQLEQRYPTLLEPRSAVAEPPSGAPPVSATSPAPAVGTGGSLDLLTVTKAARSIAAEIEPEALLKKLTRIALENAGADRGYLLLERKGELFIEAESSVESDEVQTFRSLPLDQAAGLSRAVAQYVRKTRESVVIADTAADERFASDPYVTAHSPRSILCTPIMHQGQIRGLFYLENTLTTGAFTADRLQVITILASQAAISLENATLYDEMRQEVGRRRLAEDGLRAALAEVETLRNRLQAENVYLQEEIRQQHNFTEIVGQSPALLAVLHKAEQAAPTDATVLIYGETGTGKELIARAIHDRSRRKDRPLVKVNCSAISAGLVESELFGHVKGAFTGALERRVGRFELANHGTIFLDEVGELPPETQVKLLRVLQEREFEPVGSSRSIKVDVRVIAATNRNLEEAVQTGRFRSDLFYRLNVFPLAMPALRDRRSDIPQLVMFFLSRFAKQMGKPVEVVSRATLERLASYPWPGNIRELQNIIERAVVLSEGSVLELTPGLLPGALAESGPGVAPGGLVPSGLATLDDLQRRHILAALDETGGVIEGPAGAARILKLHPNTLRSRMQKLGIRRADPKRPSG
ncbi:MAG TPA: sigma 54-interacting transcriptional regulator [Methylomirabilota bacterium]|nr:sigma 54-interacting transcriptional regulator [Methylomirabilota bacterium]